MELKVWVEGLQRVVCGLTERTTCQEIIYALAHATNQTGRFVLVEQWRSAERSLAPADRPLELLRKWGEHSKDVRFVLKCLDETGMGLMSTATEAPSPSNFVGAPNFKHQNSSFPGTTTSMPSSTSGGLSKPYFVAATGPVPESGTLQKTVAELSRLYENGPSHSQPTVVGGGQQGISNSENVVRAKNSKGGGLSVMSSSAHGKVSDALNASTAGSERSFQFSDLHNLSQTSLQSSAGTTESSASGQASTQATQRRAVSSGYLSGRPSGLKPPTYEEALKRTRLGSTTSNLSSTTGKSANSLSLNRGGKHGKFPPGREELIKMLQLQCQQSESQTKQLQGLDSKILSWAENDRILARELDTMNKELTQTERQRENLRRVLAQISSGNRDKELSESTNSLAEVSSVIDKLKSRVEEMDTEIVQKNQEAEGLEKLVEMETGNFRSRETSAVERDEDAEEAMKLLEAEINEVERKIFEKQERLKYLADTVKASSEETLSDSGIVYPNRFRQQKTSKTFSGCYQDCSNREKEVKKVPGVWV